MGWHIGMLCTQSEACMPDRYRFSPQTLVVVKQKQEPKSLCNLRVDGNCHLTRLKEAERLHKCSCE